MYIKFLITGHPRRAMRQIYWYWRLRNPSINTKLHIGCGARKRDGCINIDMNYSAAVDYVCDAGSLPCPSSSVDCIETYHLVEHLSINEMNHVLEEWCRILKPKGRLVIECPEIRRAMREYLEGNEERIYSIYGRQRFVGDTHYWGYTVDSLSKILIKIGFAECVERSPEDYHVGSEPCFRVECVKAV